MPGSTNSGDGIAVTLERINFDGNSSEDVTVFLQSVKRVAIAQERQRDDDWMVDYVEACLTGEALRWFITLDDSVLGSWRTVRNAFLFKFGAPVVQPAAAPAPAATSASVPPSASAPASTPAGSGRVTQKLSRYPLPTEVPASPVAGAQPFKILLVGDSGVGKSCLVSRWLRYGWKNQTSPTDGVAYETANVNYDGTGWAYHMWDVSGAVESQALAQQYRYTMDRVWLVYDVSDRRSFDNIRMWYRWFCASHPPKLQPALVGNKIDLVDKVVTTQQGQALANELGALFFEVSVKTNQGVQAMGFGWLPFFSFIRP
ncbi:GTP-binding protein [Tulasnella sp. 330]|nr:GTP-binding protein [Tulasnella sp. 330]